MRRDDPNLPDLVTETFASRGHGDFLSSHDLEDVLNIIDGREELIGEMANAPNDVRQAVAEAFRLLLANADFANVFPGLMAEPARAPLLWARLKMLRDGLQPQPQGQ